MHGDFKFNLMRMNLLNLANEKNIKLDQLDGFFESKGLSNVSSAEIKKQVEHLTMENFLIKNSENEYKLTDAGKNELAEVKKAIEKF